MSFPRYPKYKDSGVEWLGQVPEHWDVKRLKRACHVFPSNVDKKSYADETSVLLCNYTDVYYNEAIMSGMEFMPATATAEQIEKFTLRAGDTIITKDSETADDIAIAAFVPADLPGVVCGYHLSMVRPFDGTDGAFVKRLFDSAYARASFEVLANGLTRVGLGQYELDNVELPFPPHAEQTRIAAFLDQETAKIDELVAEQERLMTLLKEKRQAVISHAVTKGLNPKAALKPSGIEYLGDIPAHWEVKPLRYLGQCQNGLNIDGDAFGSGFPFVSYGDVYRNRVLPPSPSGLVESSELDRERYSVERGDVFFTRTSETIDEIGIASICLSTIPNATFAGFLIRFRPEVALDCSFSKHYFSNPRIGSFFAGEMNLVTRASLSQGLLKGLSVLLPPKSEQVEIGVFLDECVDTFEHLTAEAQRAIDLLQERRIALISAAVTGQIDVRPLSKKEAA
jgi:type I restriction enzyme S subunit